MNPFADMIGHFSVRTFSKLLLTIVLTEAVIMASFVWLDLDLGSFWTSLADMLLLGGISSIVLSFWVIEPLKKARKQNELFNVLVEHVDAGVVVSDVSSNENSIIFVNPAFSRITGYAQDEVIGKKPGILKSDDPDHGALAEMRRALAEQKSVRVVQRNRRKDGSMFWNDLHLNPIFDSQGNVQYWVGLIHDVTANRELERDNLRWASALQQSDEAVCMFDEHGNIEYANQAFCNNVGATAEMLTGNPVFPLWDRTSPEFSEIVASLMQRVSWSGRHKYLRDDKGSYDALSSITPFHDEQGSISFVAVHRDITEMVEMEEQLRQSQKMEAVGMLVGGIAHDFNNVLAGILGNLYLVKKELIDSPKLYERLEGVEEQGYAAAGMVRQLLSFSRKGLPDIKDVDLIPFAEELVKFARVSVPESAEFRLEIEVDRQCIVSCDPVQMQQSLLNLIVNASHAIHDKEDGSGEIILRISLSQSAPDDLLLNDSHSFETSPQAWVCISVEDNGSGMEEEIRRKIFEPFFTTKPSGVGTGLGLAMVQGYVEMLHGVVDVQSTLGVGSTFHIYLPLSNHEKVYSDPYAKQVRPGNGECILIADDDERVRWALCDILKSANYNIIEAKNGEEAMALFAEYANRLDMAILDVVMPKATGMQVAEYIQHSDKHFPVSFMTGYDQGQTLSLKLNHSHTLLRKPWDIEQLNAVLDKGLATSRQGINQL